MTQPSRLNAVFSWFFPVAILALACFLLAGCAALPSTSGYTAGTIQVRQAVAAAGNAVETEMSLAIGSGAVSPSATRVNMFKQSWQQTVEAMDAMVAYAQSIEQIVDAGNNGAESAKQVADSVTRLVETIKIDAMTGAATELVELSSQTAAFVYGEYSKVLAAKSLQEALSRVGPSIAKTSILVQKQIADVERLFVEQIEAQALELDADYRDWIKQKDLLEALQQTSTIQMVGLITPLSSSVKSKLEETAKEKDRSTWNDMSASQKESRIEEIKKERIKKLEITMDQIEATRKQIAPHIEEYKATLSQLRMRDKAGRNLIRAAENAVAAWSSSHQELVEAVTKSKPVSVESLTAAVVEIRTLTQRWREL